MLYGEHINYVLSNMRQPSVTALSTNKDQITYKVQEAVKEAVKRVWNARQWSFRLRTDTLSLTSAIGADYTLPKRVGEILTIRTNAYPYFVSVMNKSRFDLLVPNPTATGNPYIAILSDLLGVSTQLTSSATIQVSSSNATDTTQTVLIKGQVSGEDDYESLSLNGTTTVTSSKTFSRVDSITKSAATTGVITVTDGTNTLATVAPQELQIFKRKVTFYPTPTSSITATIYHLSLPTMLSNFNESTQIPPRWDYVVNQWAFALALKNQGQDQSAEYTNAFNTAIKMLEEDMRAEEQISANEPVQPLKAGEGGYSDNWMGPPSGTNWIS